jgi:hypothetical protein
MERHRAIYQTYSDVIKIEGEEGKEICRDKNEDIVTIDHSVIDALLAANKYKTDRTTNGSTTYSSVGDQLDLLWHAIDADADLKSKFSAFYNSIKAVKDANPKP